LAHPHAHLGSCRFFSGSGANLQVLGGDEDLSFAHASPDTSVQRRRQDTHHQPEVVAA
jgi:hypothetical protein